jgi:hypothetical protein
MKERASAGTARLAGRPVGHEAPGRPGIGAEPAVNTSWPVAVRAWLIPWSVLPRCWLSCSPAPPPGAPVPPILPPKDGLLLLDREKFHASFAADLPAGQAAFPADSQVPWGVDALGGSITDPTWRTLPGRAVLLLFAASKAQMGHTRRGPRKRTPSVKWRRGRGHGPSAPATALSEPLTRANDAGPATTPCLPRAMDAFRLPVGQWQKACAAAVRVWVQAMAPGRLTHSTAAWAPSPSGPKRTVGTPAAWRNAESAQ